MKSKIKIITIIAFIFSTITLVSCNQSNSKTNSKDTQIEKSLDALQSDLKDLGQSIENVAEENNEEFQDHAKQVLNKFDKKIEKFEENAKLTGEEMSETTQDAIKDLKSQSKKIAAKLDKMGDDTKENWQDLKKEVKHDFNQFGESVKDFFNDNV